MRMARVNISIPEELHRQAKEAGLNISKLARDAIAAELRAAKIAAFDEYLGELEAEFGSPTEEQLAEARAWADEVFGPTESNRKTA
jgi:post-segregation antitoxin (ccd killing protein)